MERACRTESKNLPLSRLVPGPQAAQGELQSADVLRAGLPPRLVAECHCRTTVHRLPVACRCRERRAHAKLGDLSLAGCWA
jgi:hypothetical protein